MATFSDDEVLEVFVNLPQHRGCPPTDIAEAESFVEGTLPPFYKWLMLLDEQRVIAIDDLHSVSKLQEARQNAEDVLRETEEEVEDWPVLELQKKHVIFAWQGIYCFYFFEATGADDVPVYRFVYYSSDDEWRPTVVCRSVRTFLIGAIRDYLKLM
jgi:hypothetical protein